MQYLTICIIAYLVFRTGKDVYYRLGIAYYARKVKQFWLMETHVWGAIAEALAIVVMLIVMAWLVDPHLGGHLLQDSVVPLLWAGAAYWLSRIAEEQGKTPDPEKGDA
jgi:hypothetical protein